MSETLLNADEMALVDAGMNLDAIKALRNRTGCGLRDAKDEVDRWISSSIATHRARRIRAALAAVEGIPTEALESGALGKALEALAFVASPPGVTRLREARVEAQSALRSLGRLK